MLVSKESKRPIVFISYSWSSEEHKQWVLNLANRLVAKSGFDVILDRWHLKPGHDRYVFMEESIRKANKVLVICDKKYVEKANNRGGGVGTETQIITPELYNETKQEKFVPIALEYDGNEYLLPDYFKSRFAIGMTNLEDMEDTYGVLERVLWNVELVTPPKLGEIPSFVFEGEKEQDAVQEKMVINDSNEERVLWLLPRGFLIMNDITYQSHVSWAVVISYYNYDGEWEHSTHYHESYNRGWEENREAQYRKLSIPKADWLWARAPLNFLQELRGVSEEIDIKNSVDEIQKSDYPVYYFAPGKEINLPQVPKQYKFYYETGNIRDIIKQLKETRPPWATDDEIFEIADRLRHSAFVESIKFLGDGHPSFQFIKEVIDRYDSSFEVNDIFEWFKRLAKVLETTLDHEYDVYAKKRK